MKEKLHDYKIEESAAIGIQFNAIEKQRRMAAYKSRIKLFSAVLNDNQAQVYRVKLHYLENSEYISFHKPFPSETNEHQETFKIEALRRFDLDLAVAKRFRRANRLNELIVLEIHELMLLDRGEEIQLENQKWLKTFNWILQIMLNPIERRQKLVSIARRGK